MFSKMGMRVIAAAVVMVMLGGCAEIDRRGGLADQIEDVVFRADTKSHRLLRSYLLTGVLLAVARRQGANDIDKNTIKAALESALAVTNEAFNCLYPGTFEGNDSITPENEIVQWNTTPFTLISGERKTPKWCQFFDEKMARLDVALFRLASVTLFSDQSRGQLAEIRDRLVGRLPVISDSLKAAIATNRVVGQTSTIVDDLLNVSFNSLGPVTTLLPLYRDGLELNAWIIIDSMARECVAINPQGLSVVPENLQSGPFNFGAKDACTIFHTGVAVAAAGNGEPFALRAFVNSVYGTPYRIEAYRPHFFIVSRLVRETCVSLYDATQCDTILINAVEKGAFSVNYKNSSTYRGQFTASLFPFLARYVVARSRPVVVTPANPSTATSPSRDPATTGAIPRSSGTTGQAPSR